MINITKEKLAILLGEAFDEGMCGYQDLKESFVEKIVEDCVQESTETQKKTLEESTPSYAMSLPPYTTPVSDMNIVAPSRASDYRDLNIVWENGSALVTGSWYPTVTFSDNSIINTTNIIPSVSSHGTRVQQDFLTGNDSNF